MEILQHLAVIVLLTMLLYFVLVKVMGSKEHLVVSEGKINEYIYNPPDIIDNKLPSVIEGLNLDVGTHARTTTGEAIGDMYTPNTTTLSVYNENEQGILPQNHDLFEKPANFASDVTNISQFYNNNPELFHRSQNAVHVPNAADWDERAKGLFAEQANQVQGPINAYNFESGAGELI